MVRSLSYVESSFGTTKTSVFSRKHSGKSIRAGMLPHVCTSGHWNLGPFQVERKFSVEICPLTGWLQKIHPFCGGWPARSRSVSYRDVNLSPSWFPCAVNYSSHHLEQRSMTLLLPGLCRGLIPAKIASPLNPLPLILLSLKQRNMFQLPWVSPAGQWVKCRGALLCHSPVKTTNSRCRRAPPFPPQLLML